MTINTDFLWYKLFNVQGFGPKSIHLIYEEIRRNGLSLESIFNMNKSEFESTFPEIGKGRLRKANFEAIKELNEEEIYQEHQDLKNKGIEIIYCGHKSYPERLLQFIEYGVPPILFCRGAFSLLKSDSVSIVGSRNASDEGLKIAKEFATELAMQGKNVISGYAKGIDTHVHLGALEKDGTTTIVLSFGILEFSKKKVFDNLRWKGNTLIISQFHPKEKWSARNAMIRNKLVCALSKAVIVIESGEERGKDGSMSGTFDAGKAALEMKIPLFVVGPASFKNPPLGNTELIKRGGIEISPKSAIVILLKHLEMNSIKGAEPSATEKQMSFFK